MIIWWLAVLLTIAAEYLLGAVIIFPLSLRGLKREGVHHGRLGTALADAMLWPMSLWLALSVASDLQQRDHEDQY